MQYAFDTNNLLKKLYKEDFDLLVFSVDKKQFFPNNYYDCSKAIHYTYKRIFDFYSPNKTFVFKKGDKESFFKHPLLYALTKADYFFNTTIHEYYSPITIRFAPGNSLVHPGNFRMGLLNHYSTNIKFKLIVDTRFDNQIIINHLSKITKPISLKTLTKKQVSKTLNIKRLTNPTVHEHNVGISITEARNLLTEYQKDYIIQLFNDRIKLNDREIGVLENKLWKLPKNIFLG